MPRIAPVAIRSALRVNRHVPRLLPECQDVRSAQNEIRWMKESILEQNLGNDQTQWDFAQDAIWSEKNYAGKQLKRYVDRRARGEPLQYILGTQPFGQLDIRCKPQVLIPRGETEVYTTELASILRKLRRDGVCQDLSIADFCTGTGCIALLLHSLLRPPNEPAHQQGKLSVKGFDISQHALDLARLNQQRNLALKTLHRDARLELGFVYTDVMELGSMSMQHISNRLSDSSFDVIVSNPPYISPQHFAIGGPTSRSVRRFEPKLALVPSSELSFPDICQADQFYVALIRIAMVTKVKLLFMEVGDDAQAARVMDLCKNMRDHVDDPSWVIEKHLTETWRDDASVVLDDQDLSSLTDVAVSGGGEQPQSRAVVVWFDGEWIAHRHVHR